jgi:hypothetical protein
MANPSDAGVREVVDFFSVIMEQDNLSCQTVHDNPGSYPSDGARDANQLLEASLTIFSFCSLHYKNCSDFFRTNPAASATLRLSTEEFSKRIEN